MIPEVVPRVVYGGTGSNTLFAIEKGNVPIYFAENSEIIVSRWDGEVETTLVPLIDYTITGAGSLQGGEIETVEPVGLDELLVIRRQTPRDQQLDLVRGGTLDLDRLEATIDRNVRITQELSDAIDRALKIDVRGPEFGGGYDVEGHRLRNVGDAQEDTDAVTLQYLQTALAPIAFSGSFEDITPKPPVVRSGQGEPSPSIGFDGDIYVDVLNAQLYGPKSNDLWGSPRSLIGPEGPRGVNWLGEWEPGTYQPLDAVSHSGSSWIALIQTTQEPSDSATDWDLLAAKGEQGAPGAGNGDVIGPASAIPGNLASYSGSSGKIIADSGIASADVLLTAAIGVTVQPFSANLVDWAAADIDDYDTSAEVDAKIAALSSVYEPLDPDILKADEPAILEAGYSSTPFNAGTKSSGTFTPDPDDGNMQIAVNNGAHTLAAPSISTSILIHYTNGASAGAITPSGFTKVSGAEFTTNPGDQFLVYVTKIGSVAHLFVEALQ